MTTPSPILGIKFMRRTKSGLPKHCGWNTDQHGTRRVRFSKGGFSTYLTGIPWSEDFMRQYAAALEGVEARKTMIGADRSPAGSLAWLVAAYLDGSSGIEFAVQDAGASDAQAAPPHA